MAFPRVNPQALDGVFFFKGLALDLGAGQELMEETARDLLA